VTEKPVAPDVGVFGSLDPVACEQAAWDRRINQAQGGLANSSSRSCSSKLRRTRPRHPRIPESRHVVTPDTVGPEPLQPTPEPQDPGTPPRPQFPRPHSRRASRPVRGPGRTAALLVRKNELDVADVPVGRLTDDFLGAVPQGPGAGHGIGVGLPHHGCGPVTDEDPRPAPPRPGRGPEHFRPSASEQIMDEFHATEQVGPASFPTRSRSAGSSTRVPASRPRAKQAESEDVVALAAGAQTGPCPNCRRNALPRSRRPRSGWRTRLPTCAVSCASVGPLISRSRDRYPRSAEVIVLFIAVLGARPAGRNCAFASRPSSARSVSELREPDPVPNG